MTHLAKRTNVNMELIASSLEVMGLTTSKKSHSSDNYKKVFLKYQNDCLRARNTNDNSKRKIAKGTEAEGVYFNAFHSVAAPNFQPFGYNCIISSSCPKELAGIMILHTKNGTEFGTAFMFNLDVLQIPKAHNLP